MWLLDTVTISELIKTQSNTAALEWLESQDSSSLFTSTICLGELRYGQERLAPGRRKTELKAWINVSIIPFFAQRILSVDVDVSKTWAELRALSPRTFPVLDSLIAATALTHDLIVVTRNTKDFEAFGVQVFNPWA